jgi:hypothetical protein
LKNSTHIKGLGEQLIYSDFARSLSEEIRNNDPGSDNSRIIKLVLDRFIAKNNTRDPSAGFISLSVVDGQLEYWYGFTTESMGMGYFHGSKKSPKSSIERKTVDSNYRISGIFFRPDTC